MRPLSIVLTELIVFTEQLVTRPLQARFGTDYFDRLAAEIRAADARPAEDVRVTNAALIAVIMIEQFRDGGAASAAWLMLAGAMLPLLREEGYVALRIEKEARAS